MKPNWIRNCCILTFVAGFCVAKLGTSSGLPIGATNLKDSPSFANTEGKSDSAPMMQMALSDGWMPIVNSNSFYQEVSFEDDRQQLIVRSTEWDADRDEWDECTYAINCSFGIIAVRAIGTSNEFFVLGEGKNGDSILEHWVASIPAGRRYIDRTKCSVPLGSPAEIAPVTSGISGGVYVSPPPQVAIRTERTELFRGDELGSLTSFSVEPNGRFVLALAYSGDLFQLDLTSDAEPVQISDRAEMPGLRKMTSFYTRVHSSLGVCYVLDASEAWEYHNEMIVLHDLENDGLVDDITSYTEESFFELHEANSSGWVDDLINYYEF